MFAQLLVGGVRRRRPFVGLFEGDEGVLSVFALVLATNLATPQTPALLRKDISQFEPFHSISAYAAVLRFINQFLSFARASTAAMASSSFNEATEAARLKSITSFMPELWKTVQDNLPRRQLLSYKEKPWEDLSNHNVYGLMKQTKYYTMRLEEKPTRGWQPVVKATDQESERVLNAYKMYNSCIGVCLVFLELLESLFKGDHYVKRVEWTRFLTKPNLVLLPEGEVTAYWHDVLLLRSRSDRQYVLDISGAQFGYQEWFFTLEDYQKLHVFTDCPTKTETDLGDALRRAYASSENMRFVKHLADELYHFVQYKVQFMTGRAVQIRDLPDEYRTSVFEWFASVLGLAMEDAWVFCANNVEYWFPGAKRDDPSWIRYEDWSAQFFLYLWSKEYRAPGPLMRGVSTGEHAFVRKMVADHTREL